MHPILREILMEPVGWLAIGGSIVMVGIAFAVATFSSTVIAIPFSWMVRAMTAALLAL